MNNSGLIFAIIFISSNNIALTKVIAEIREHNNKVW